MSLPVTTTLLTFALGALAGFYAARALAVWFKERRLSKLRLRARACRQICLDP